jgi:hypothetical protein
LYISADKKGYPGSILSLDPGFFFDQPSAPSPRKSGHPRTVLQPHPCRDAVVSIRLFTLLFLCTSLLSGAELGQTTETRRRVEQPLRQAIDTRQSTQKTVDPWWGDRQRPAFKQQMVLRLINDHAAVRPKNTGDWRRDRWWWQKTALSLTSIRPM